MTVRKPTRWDGLCHYYLPTTRNRIIWYCEDSHLESQLQAIISGGRDHPEYMMRLAVYAKQIYFLFTLVYRGQDGKYKKLSAEQYSRLLFLDCAETPAEIWEKYAANNREEIFRIYKAVCDAVSPMLAHIGNDRFWPDDIAFIVDFILKEKGNVPAPDLRGWGVPYPHNYPKSDRHFLPVEIMI